MAGIWLSAPAKKLNVIVFFFDKLLSLGAHLRAFPLLPGTWQWPCSPPPPHLDPPCHLLDPSCPLLEILVITNGAIKSMHYRLRPIESVQFRFDNFAPHFEGNYHYHFLIHRVLL